MLGNTLNLYRRCGATFSLHGSCTCLGAATMIKRKAALAGLIIALTSICGCHKTPTKSPGSGTLPTFNPSDPGPGHHHGREHDREFKVYIYTDTGDPKQPCFADFPKAVLWKDKSPTTGKTQTVTWFSDDGLEYYVDFLQPKGSPFPGSKR